jgi:rubredoxin
MGTGIDYGGGITNIDTKTGIRYGVICQNEVLQAWADSSEAYYGNPDDVECPKCGMCTSAENWGDSVECLKCGNVFEAELGDFAEPISFFLDDGELIAECFEDGDIFITASPYYTTCEFCSPCAPGAGYVINTRKDGVKAYCFGHDWFDNGKAPYPVYSVQTGKRVKPENAG